MTISIKSLTACTLAAASLGLLAGPAAAQAATGLGEHQQQRVDSRQQRQSDRIAHGVESGQITAREQVHVERQQRHINRVERRTEADGKVTPREAVRVERAQDRASRDIHRTRHNGRTRGG